mmetsp:Transcript_35583/g.79041  ORF Transcript_35583/g.79041 Transcript_35583/m.79041 type:complete len:254 (+) Transcript_35583:224-985(+)
MRLPVGTAKSVAVRHSSEAACPLATVKKGAENLGCKHVCGTWYSCNHNAGPRSCGGKVRCLANQLNIKLQHSVGGNHTASAPGAVAELCGDDKPALAANLHGGNAISLGAQDTNIPALNDHAHTNGERQRLAALVAAVKDSAVAGQATSVVAPDPCALGRCCPGSNLNIAPPQTIRSSHWGASAEARGGVTGTSEGNNSGSGPESSTTGLQRVALGKARGGDDERARARTCDTGECWGSTLANPRSFDRLDPG